MARLSFPLAAVKAEWEAVQAASSHCKPYCSHPSFPALWLVGDEGVYLMGNDRGRVPEGEGGRPVVYARECPRGDYDAKVAHFGGDDGVEEIAGADVRSWIAAAEKHGHGSLVIEIGAESFGLLFACGEPV